MKDDDDGAEDVIVYAGEANKKNKSPQQKNETKKNIRRKKSKMPKTGNLPDIYWCGTESLSCLRFCFNIETHTHTWQNTVLSFPHFSFGPL